MGAKTIEENGCAVVAAARGISQYRNSASKPDKIAEKYTNAAGGLNLDAAIRSEAGNQSLSWGEATGADIEKVLKKLEKADGKFLVLGKTTINTGRKGPHWINVTGINDDGSIDWIGTSDNDANRLYGVGEVDSDTHALERILYLRMPDPVKPE